MAVAKADEHVLGLNAPIVDDGPLDAAAKCPGRNCVAGVSGCDNPVAASGRDCLTIINHRTANLDKCCAALDVEQGPVPGITQPARNHAVPVADLAASEHVWRSCPERWTAERIKG